jgi:hypothetical protein
MIQMMTTTLQAAGLTRGDAAAAVPVSARIGDAVRRTIGFAITASGYAVIVAHGLHRIVAG